jgi:hypothetical protein
LSFSAALYSIGRWLFCFRYFELAEILGRKDKSTEAHIKARAMTSKINVTVVILIVVLWVLFLLLIWRITLAKDQTNIDLTSKYYV